MTLGQLTSFCMYLGLMIWPMLALAWMFNIIERVSAAYSRISQLISEVPSVTDGLLPIMIERGELDVNIVQFTYPMASKASLTNIHIHLKAGNMLGLCGMTGSGKTTLLALIQRQFNVTDGRICYQNVELSRFHLDEWRGRVAVVNQIPFLFSASIIENIALGVPEATEQQIESVACLACIHDDILRLPQGYKTEVGERGVMLSGGQKQRITIARALLLDAEILILDDALSAVDGKTEHHILANRRATIK